MSKKPSDMHRAALALRGSLGSYARGWVDGYAGNDPKPWGQYENIKQYETGWLEGAEQKEKE